MVGLVAALSLPFAIVATRWSDAYELVHAGVAIPVTVALGVVAIGLGGAARRLDGLSLGRTRVRRVATLGRLLGGLALCLAASGLISVSLYGILTYLGDR